MALALSLSACAGADLTRVVDECVTTICEPRTGDAARYMAEKWSMETNQKRAAFCKSLEE